MDKNELDRFFNPSSIAVIGASKTPGKIGYEILKSLLDSEYEGNLYPINPTAEEILGLKAYPSLIDVKGSIDLAVIALKAELTLKIIEDCISKA